MTGQSGLGANESALLGRRCLPCPANLRCNPLATVDAPHEIVGSRFPLLPAAFGTALPRRALVSAIGFSPCLHPAVCNTPLEVAVSDWPQWSSLVANGSSSSPAVSEFLCRAGHDPSSFMCSRCLPDFYLNGFLWFVALARLLVCVESLTRTCAFAHSEPCQRGFTALVPVAVVGAILLLGAFIYKRIQRQCAQSGVATDEASIDESVSLVLWFLQVSSTLQVSSQINMARGGVAEAATPVGITWLDTLFSFRPWATECSLGTVYDFTSATVGLLVLPWLVVIAAAVLVAAVPRRAYEWKSGAAMLLDLMYLPVGQRSIEWFNRDTSSASQLGRVRGAARGGDGRERGAGGIAPLRLLRWGLCLVCSADRYACTQCVLRLAPYVDCDSASYYGVLALAVPTFALFVVVYPIVCSVALWRGETDSSLAASIQFMQMPLRISLFRPLWAAPYLYGRKLLFAALVGGARSEDYAQTLPMLVFCSLLALLVVQVATRTRAR